MQRISEYLERGLLFERLAAEELNPQIKAEFEKQAAAYRKLGADRAKKLGAELSAVAGACTPARVHRVRGRVFSVWLLVSALQDSQNISVNVLKGCSAHAWNLARSAVESL
jgi:hypothetical protein